MHVNTTSSFKPYIPQPTPPLVPGISDLHLSLVLPIIIHWLTSAFFEICDRTGWLQQYRLHTYTEQLSRNRVTRRECLRVTLQCQALQTLFGLALGALGDGEDTGGEDDDLSVWIKRVHLILSAIPNLICLAGIDVEAITIKLHRLDPKLPATGHSENGIPSIQEHIGKMLYRYIVPTFQLASALIIADACMYCLHRLGHTNKWIYKHIHSQHHRLYVPYSWGGSYNHPIDSIFVDGLSYGIGCWATGLSTKLSIILFAYGTFKNVTDHCGYVFPWNPLRSLTGTDAGFHDVHHQSWGLKTNFGAHLSIWDRMMGTYFADEEQISKLRERSRIVVGEFVPLTIVNGDKFEP